jgi:hypothetical protein
MFLLATNPSDVAELSNRFAHGIAGGSSEGDFAMNLKPLALAFVLALGFDCSADTLTGTVRDAKGRPVADARVDIATAAPKVGPAMFCPSCYLDCAKWTRTDADGKFVIAKLSPSLKFRLLATAPDMLSAMTKLVDPATENPAITLDPIPAGLPPDRTLSGRVVDAAGRPIAGALISPEGAETREQRWWGLVEGVRPTVSDTDGRFLMILDRSYLGVDLEVMSSGFAGTSSPLLAPGSKPHTITLPLGARVTGRLLDDSKPVAGIQIAIVQLDRNAGTHFIKAVGATTDDAGRFVFENLPASQKYAIFSSVSSNSPTSAVLATRTLMVPADGASIDIGILPALPPMRLSGRVIFPDGARVPPQSKVSLGRDPAWDLIAVPVAEDGTFSVAPLPPETYIVNVVAKGFEVDPSGLKYQTIDAKSFGVRIEESIKNLTIPMKRSAPKADRAATEEPANDADRDKVLADYERSLEKPGTVTLVGRVLKAGKPRPGVTMSLYRSPAETPNRHASKPFVEVKTDDLGRYAVPGLAAGDGYFFKVHPGDTSDDSGWTHQSPYLQTLRPETAGFVRLPDIRLIDREQSLSGIVIDPNGNPVSGVTVSAKIADSYIHVSRPEDGPPPWVETDANGRFDLRQLPNLPIELIAYVSRPEGGTILHPAIARPERNQSDIRILFDPALTKKPESLTTTAETRPSP